MVAIRWSPVRKADVRSGIVDVYFFKKREKNTGWKKALRKCVQMQ